MTIRLALTLFLTIVLAVVAGAQDVSKLSRRIAKEKDKVDVAVFAELADVGDAEALAALEKAVGQLKKRETLEPAYRAFTTFATGETELADGARAFLSREAFRAKNRDLRPVVVECLLAFGDAALPALERAITDHADARCRQIACDPLVLMLSMRGTQEDLVSILENASLHRRVGVRYLGVAQNVLGFYHEEEHREVVKAAVKSVPGPEASAALIGKLQAKDTSRSWKMLLIEIFAERQGEDALRALAGALRDDDAAVVLETLERIVARPGAEGLADDLRPLFKSPSPAVRRAAVAAMGRLELTDPEARADLYQLAGSSDSALRMGAASALVEIRTVEARQLLNGLLTDKDWSVRAEALAQVARLRDKSSIPILLERIDEEMGRLRRDVIGSLCTITGEDFGRGSALWKRWWENEGEKFEVPPAAVIEQLERDRLEREREQLRTEASTFYGVEVFSERVCFVLDVSGSMRLNAGKNVDPNGPQDPSKPSRMDIAKEELTKIVRAFPDGKLFNLIFFESEVRSLSKRLVKMKKSERQRSLRFIREQYSLGSTALYPALQLAFSDPLVDTIYLISDGAPTEGEITDIAEIRAEVRRWNGARRIRIHGITIGQDSTLLQWLTQDTGGTYLRRD